MLFLPELVLFLGVLALCAAAGGWIGWWIGKPFGKKRIATRGGALGGLLGGLLGFAGYRFYLHRLPRHFTPDEWGGAWIPDHAPARYVVWVSILVGMVAGSAMFGVATLFLPLPASPAAADRESGTPRPPHD